MATKATLEVGKTYLVRIGGENLSSLYEAEVKIESSSDGTEVTFTWGDVNGDDSANGTDAVYVIKSLAGGSVKPEDGQFNIGDPITGTYNSSSVSFTWGDVNGDNSANGTDAVYVIKSLAGGSVKPENGQFNIGDPITLTIPNA